MKNIPKTTLNSRFENPVELIPVMASSLCTSELCTPAHETFALRAHLNQFRGYELNARSRRGQTARYMFKTIQICISGSVKVIGHKRYGPFTCLYGTASTAFRCGFQLCGGANQNRNELAICMLLIAVTALPRRKRYSLTAPNQ